MDCLRRFAQGCGAAALSIALLLGVGAAYAAADKPNERHVVALAYDAATDSLLKAYPHALYRSSDGGKEWRDIAIPNLETGRIVGVAPSPAAKGVIYIAGPGLGVLRTTDGGSSWSGRSQGLPSRDVIAIAAHTTLPDTVYSVVKDSGVYRSQDGGKTWRLMDRSSQGGIRQLIHSDMPGSMKTGWLFAATPTGVRRVMDCFCLWQDAGKLDAPTRSVAYDPRQPARLFAATAKGLFRSTDGGEDWVRMTSPGADIAALAFAPSGTLFAISADGSLFRSRDQGEDWDQVNA